MQIQADTTKRISTIVGGLLTKRGAPATVDPKADLLAAGLSSLDLVNLMLAVEGEFDLFLPEDRMTPDNFRSVAAIQALVATLA